MLRKPADLKAVLGRDQLRLYKLIWERFVASQMAPATLDTMSVDLENNGLTFRANGSKVKFSGFMKVYVEGKDDQMEEKNKMLPDLTEGDTVLSKDIEPEQHFTQPPPRYTEARLVKTLEELGIGRPSTYAPTLDTIQKRGYVALDNKRFLPTELGEIVLELIMEFFPEIINVEFTAKMEKELDDVEDGNIQWVQIIDSFYKDFEKRVEKAEAEMQEVEIEPEYAGVDCENCGHPMVYKMGRYGKFMACSISPTAAIRSRSSKKSASNARPAKPETSLSGNRKNAASFTAVTVTLNANSCHGINRLSANVRNAGTCLLRKSSKKAFRCNARAAIIRKNNKSSGEQGFAHLLCCVKRTIQFIN